MRTYCSQCKQTLDEDGPAMTCYGNEEVYCLCSKECGDKWVYPSDSRLNLEQKQLVVQRDSSCFKIEDSQIKLCINARVTNVEIVSGGMKGLCCARVAPTIQNQRRGRGFGPQKRNGSATDRPKRDPIHFQTTPRSFGSASLCSPHLVPI